MNMYPVHSFIIASMGYENEVLIVELRSGSVYKYVGVPLSLYEKLMAAPSQGSFYQDYISGNFDERRINSDDCTIQL